MQVSDSGESRTFHVETRQRHLKDEAIFGSVADRPGYQAVLKLSQTQKERARQFEICGFESFREAVVHESQRLPGLIAMSAFAEQAGQDHGRPQLPGERRLCACDSERFAQAVHR